MPEKTIVINGANSGAIAQGDHARAAVQQGNGESGKIKAGDTVRLKSGGPAMTVDAITDGGLSCCWFVGKQPAFAVFREVTLKIDSSRREDQ